MNVTLKDADELGRMISGLQASLSSRLADSP